MTEQLKVPTQRDLATYKATATKVVNKANATEIATEADYTKAGDQLVLIKGAEREVTERKNKIVKPLNEALKETRNLFRPIEDQLAAARKVVQDSMLSFRQKAEAERQRIEQEAQAKLDQGEITEDEAIDSVAAASSPAKTMHGARGKTTVRTTREIEVVDAALIPRQYLVPDLVAIRRRALGIGCEPAEIPGVKVVERESIV